jgi:ubiquinone/menaquinone biosynthesis C-methylase UbiE
MTGSQHDENKQIQRQSWDNVALGWQKWSKIFENGAQTVSDKLIELADITPNSKVLDIATGIGEPAITAANRIGNSSGGYVLATDLSPQMLSIAKNRAKSLNLDKIMEFKEGDAETITLPSSEFDAALSRLGLMFLPNIDIGLANIYKSLRDGGRFAAAVWSTADKVPQLSLPMNISRREANVPPPPAGTPGPFSLANEKLLYDVFKKAGFKNIQIEKVMVTFLFNTAEDFTKFTQDIAAPVNAILKNQSKEHTEKIWEMITQEVSKYTTTKYDNGDKQGPVSLDNEAICIVGIK